MTKFQKLKKIRIKDYIPAVAAVFILQAVFLLLITLCALIPKSAIEKNVKKSADYYSDQYMFRQMTKDENSTIVHNYADLVWLNIAWCQESDAPFSSALNAGFYEGKDIYKSESLIGAVYDGKTPDKSYSRYWHGALTVIKPLLTVTDILGIRKINAVICALFAVILSVMLIKRKLYALFAGYAVAMAVSFSYIVPLCMEYMPSFLIMHIAGIFILKYGEDLQRRTLCVFFAAVGALICFFDFLTNEILTLFVPLIFFLCIRDKTQKENDAPLLETVQYSMMWGFGYVMTWFFKWFMCLAVLGKAAFRQAVFEGAYRMMGEVPNIEQNQIIGALVKNLNRLFPLNFVQSETTVWLIFSAIVFVLFCVFFLYRKENVPKIVWTLLLISAAPYARYMCLSNHSCLHPFFTFRSQIITVIALFAVFEKGIDFDTVLKRRKKKCRKKN